MRVESNGDTFALNLDLEPVEHRFTFKGKRYILREASGDAAIKYRNALAKATRFGPGGEVVGFNNIADTEPVLVMGCLFEEYDRREGNQVLTLERPVTEQQVKAFSNGNLKKMYEWCRKQSHLMPEDDEESLVKQIEELQDRLARVRRAGGTPTPPGEAVNEGEEPADGRGETRPGKTPAPETTSSA